MKSTLLTVAGSLLLLFSHAQRIGIETGVGICSPNFTLKKTIPVFVQSPYIDVMKVNRVVTEPNLQFPLISVYFKTLNHFKISFFFQHHSTSTLKFLSESYYFGYDPPITAQNSSETKYINYNSDYTSNDIGTGVEWFFRRNRPLQFSLNGRLTYKTKFKAQIENYVLDEDVIEGDFTEINKTISSLGNFIVAGGGFGLHYKNLSWTWNFFCNITTIEHSTEKYLDRNSGFGTSLTYGIDKELPLFEKRKKNKGKFSFLGTSKNNLFIEVSMNLYNKAVSKGESVVTYIRPNDSPSYLTDNDGMLHYVDTNFTEVPVYALFHFHKAPKVGPSPSLAVGFSNKLSEKFSLLIKTSFGIWRFKYEDIWKGNHFLDAFADNLNIDFLVLNLALTQGLKVNNLFSVKKNTAFCSISISERFQQAIFIYTEIERALYKRMYLSTGVEFGFNRFQNSISIGLEGNLTPLTTSALNYKINGLYSGYIRLTHNF